MSMIIQEISNRHADSNTIYHCLYGYYFLKKSKSELARIFHKNRLTVSRWINRYEAEGTCSRLKGFKRNELRKFNAEHREWIIQLFNNSPLHYLEEAKRDFQKHFKIIISISTICRILAEYGYTWKSIERRAIYIRDIEIINYYNELSCISWDLSSLLFLDEVSFDNLGLLRNRGYAVRGERLYHRGEYIRKPRISLLCFLQQKGLIEVFRTEGTFTRLKFFEFCRQLATSGKVNVFPGKGSIWIMDGAKIHCDTNIIRYLRSLGIIPIFLPAYCPFFNPIELIFGYIKKYVKKINFLNNHSLEICISKAIEGYSNFNCRKFFHKCGYLPNGTFNPALALDQPLKNFDF